MKKEKQLELIKNYVLHTFQKDYSGHDFHHMKRVATVANHLALKESGDLFICQAAAWLHDIGDIKLSNEPEQALHKMNQFLCSIDLTEADILQINIAIKDVSFRKGNIPETIEGKIVQDADRLDAIGAIGIARTFAFGGANGQLLYNETGKQNTSLQHFYDKLFKIYPLLHTTTAKQIAKERHQFMITFVEQFLSEWNKGLN